MQRSTARLTSCLVLSLVLGGCAFPLFNVEDRQRPRTLAYRPGHNPTGVTPRESSGEPRPTPVLGPRRGSVLDPSPREPAPDRSAGACYAALREAGVPFQRVREPTPGVRWPIRFRGPVRGVLFEQLDRDATFAVLDCRLALSLLEWAPVLRRSGVRKVMHYSMYRPGARIGGSGAVSSHAHGLAIDAARFELDNGVVVNVLDDWRGRRRGQAPCPVRRDEPRGARLLRRVTCGAVDRGLFQVVLTPHYNRAHANHLHLELRPDVTWQFVK